MNFKVALKNSLILPGRKTYRTSENSQEIFLQDFSKHTLYLLSYLNNRISNVH